MVVFVPNFNKFLAVILVLILLNWGKINIHSLKKFFCLLNGFNIFIFSNIKLFLYTHAHIFIQKKFYPFIYEDIFHVIVVITVFLPISLSLYSFFNEYWCFKAARKVLTRSLTCDILLCRIVTLTFSWKKYQKFGCLCKQTKLNRI